MYIQKPHLMYLKFTYFHTFEHPKTRSRSGHLRALIQLLFVAIWICNKSLFGILRISGPMVLTWADLSLLPTVLNLVHGSWAPVGPPAYGSESMRKSFLMVSTRQVWPINAAPSSSTSYLTILLRSPFSPLPPSQRPKLQWISAI